MLDEPPVPGGTGLRRATHDDLELLVPACAAAHREEIGIDPLERDPDGFRWRTRSQIEQGRSWLWREAPRSCSRPRRRRGRRGRAAPAGLGRPGGAPARATRAARSRDLCRLLLERVPTVCLFVRAENVPAIRLYDAVGMRRVLAYRSLIF